MAGCETTVCIDGSAGEGGGQVLRTSLALSLLTGRTVRLSNIRARRGNPGLRRQHITAVKAAAAVGRASVEGAEIGSRELLFAPRGVFPGDYAFDVGSAGSTTLVLQTVLPPLLVAGGPSAVTVCGGTHNYGAPPLEYLSRVLLPLIGRMGPSAMVTLHRHGFYPRGGGRVVATVRPAARLAALDLPHRGPVRRVCARALVAGLPQHIARRELEAVRNGLGRSVDELAAEELDAGCGPGNCIMLEVECENVTEIFTGFGRRGVRAETVAREAAAEARAYLDAPVAVGPHLADQLLVYLALAGGGRFTTLPLTSHATTNMDVIRRFVDIAFAIAENDGIVTVTASGSAPTPAGAR